MVFLENAVKHIQSPCTAACLKFIELEGTYRIFVVEIILNICVWGEVKVIYHGNVNKIILSLHHIGKYSLKVQFSQMFFLTVQGGKFSGCFGDIWDKSSVFTFT